MRTAGGRREGAERQRGARGRARYRAAVVGAGLLVAGLCAGCVPVDEYKVTNATDEIVVLWGESVMPGDTRRFVSTSGCDDLVIFTEDGEHVAVFPEVCDDDRVEVARDDLRRAEQAVVVNATSDPVQLRYLGAWLLADPSLEPGAELRVPLSPVEARCRDDEYLQPEIGVVRPRESRGDDVVARYWDELCAGSRWVLDDKSMAAGGPATVAVTNETGMALEVWPHPGDLWTEPTMIADAEAALVQLPFPRGGCETAGLAGEALSATEMRLREDLTGTCGGELVLTRADLTSYERGGGWQPIDGAGPTAEP